MELASLLHSPIALPSISRVIALLRAELDCDPIAWTTAQEVDALTG